MRFLPLHTSRQSMQCYSDYIDFGNCCAARISAHALRYKCDLWSIAAFSFLAWLLGRSCFISPLCWSRHCKNRHTGNRLSFSEELLRRGPGPMARFPTLRYRPEHFRHLVCNDVLWNPFTFWEAVVVNSRLGSFESACLPDFTVLSHIGNFHALKLFQKELFLLQPKHLLIYYPFSLPCLIYCVPERP